MENELVKENKKACNTIIEYIDNEIKNFQEKGFSDTELAVLKSLSYDTRVIKADRRRSQASAEENRLALIGIQAKLDDAIVELTKLDQKRNASKKVVELNKFMKLRKSVYDKYYDYKTDYVVNNMDLHDLNALTYLHEDMTAYCKDYKAGKVSPTVVSDYNTFESRYNTICSNIDAKLADKKAKDEKNTPVLVTAKDETVYDAKTKEQKSNFGKRALQVVLAGALILAMACGLKSCADKKKNAADKGLTTADTTQTSPENTENNNNTEVKVDDNTTVVITQNMGEYGTFTDINDPVQLQARVDYIYNIYQGFEGKQADGRETSMYSEHKARVTKEAIENLIREINGLPPVNESGDYYMTANLRSEIQNNIADFFMNIPSGVYDKDDVKYYTVVPSHLFVPDNSKASEFLKGYDDIYQEFSDAYNNNDGQGAYKAGQKMVEMMFYQWHMDGAEGMGNPYSELKPEQIKFAKMMSVDRWTNYFYEYEQDAQLAICVPLCINYETKELEDVRGDELQTALTFDLWNEPVAKSAGLDDEVNYGRYQNQVFMDYWMNEITYQYENNYKGKNVNDGKSLSLNK